jgi:hypothetical protein
MRMSTVRRGRIAAIVLLLGAGLLHCTFGDLDELGVGSKDAAVPPEAGEAAADVASSDDGEGGPIDTGSPSDAGMHDADADADAAPGLTDSGAPDAAGSDAAAEAEAAGPTPPASALPYWLDAGSASWCTTFEYEATFCADFDETPLPAGFSASDGPFLAETSSVPDPSSGAPNDLLLYVPPQSATGTFGSKLSRLFQISATTIDLSFDIMPESLNMTSSGLLFAALDFTEKPVPSSYSLRLAYNAGLPRLEESYLGDGPPDIYHSNFDLPVGVWSRVDVHIVFASPDGGGADGGGATESVFVGGVLQGIPEVLTPPAGFDSRPNLLIGAVYGTSPTEGWAIRYDNVALTLQ